MKDNLLKVEKSLLGQRERAGLLRLNLCAALLHGAQALVVILIANDFTLPISGFFWNDAPNGRLDPDRLVRIIDFRVSHGLVAFLGLSALFHLLVSVGWGRSRYYEELSREQNRFRWVEYSLSSTVMVLLIAMVFGISDVAALFGLAGSNMAMILFGWIMEIVNKPGQKVWWTPFLFGCLVGCIPWVALLWYLVGPGGEMPSFVYGIFLSIFVLFNLFALNQFLQYKRVGRWREYLYGERIYLVLSLTAKSALAWQIFANTLVS
jgi:hypothetical protein